MVAEESSASCFVIMPISMPDHLVDVYPEEENHFPRVYSEIFAPAITAAALMPVRPDFGGSQVIQAEIIRNLDEARLVLCDMSALNPNVFFELGVRSALNKAVAMVRDERTTEIPFDVGPVSAHTYQSDFRSWIVKDQIEAMTTHVELCLATSEEKGGTNHLWQQFGLRVQGTVEPGTSDEVQQAILSRLDNISQDMAKVLGRARPTNRPTAPLGPSDPAYEMSPVGPPVLNQSRSKRVSVLHRPGRSGRTWIGTIQVGPVAGGSYQNHEVRGEPRRTDAELEQMAQLMGRIAADGPTAEHLRALDDVMPPEMATVLAKQLRT